MSGQQGEIRYHILISNAAQKDIRKIQKQDAKRIDQRILDLADSPRAHGVVKLSNKKDLYRVRAGEHRILFKIDDETHTVTIARVKHRREAY